MGVVPPEDVFFALPACGANPRVTYTTRLATTLFLLYTLTPPDKIPKFKVNRGVRERCGSRYRYAGLTCLSQLETPPSTTHTFQLPSFPAGTKIYFFRSTTCVPTAEKSTGPPQTYTYETCGPGTFQCVVSKTTAQSAGTCPTGTITWNTEDLDTDNMWDPAVPGRVKILQTADYYLLLAVKWRNRFLSTSTAQVQIHIRKATGQVLSSFTGPLVTGSTTIFTYVTSYVGQLNSGEELEARFCRVTGTGSPITIAESPSTTKFEVRSAWAPWP